MTGGFIRPLLASSSQLLAPNRGFTYIEILVTLMLLAILFVPMMQLFSHAVGATNTSREIITASSLVRWEMERVKNLATSTQRVRMLGNTLWPPEGEPPFELNGRAWRIYRFLEPDSDPLRVTVEVRLEGEPKALARLETLLSDTTWANKPQ